MNIFSSIQFRLMSFFLRRLKTPDVISSILAYTEIKEGSTVLDYACGPGLFSVQIASIVGTSGHVYAADINPTSKWYLEKTIQERKINNLTLIITDYKLNLPDQSIDTIILFDCIFLIKNRENVLKELHRVLKSQGKLIVDVNHLSSMNTKELAEEFSYFRLSNKKIINKVHSAELLFFSKR